MKILITGAFGNLGLMCVERALALGHEVCCIDVYSHENRRRADAYGHRVHVMFGDIRDVSMMADAVEGADGIIHHASVLPPLTETHSHMAWAVNVEGTRQLIRLAERESARSQRPIRFIFPSSVTVFGTPTLGEAPRTVEDAVAASDNYTDHKLQCEQMLRASSLLWSILRVGVSVDARTLSTDWHTFTSLLRVRENNPVEYVHPKDVAFAMCQALSAQDAIHKTLLIGGGPDCQITQAEFLGVAIQACGLTVDHRVFGQRAFYTHWMDTSESQHILQFQQHTFDHYQQEMAGALANVRRVLTPLRPMVNRVLPHLLRWVSRE